MEIRKISEKYETEIEYGLGLNKEKEYIGRFFDIKNKLSIWAGYDNATEHLCISFYSEKYKEQLISALEDLHLNYSAEYIAFDDEGYWYSIFVDVPYKTNADKNRESKVSANEIDYSSLEKDIAEILKKIDAEIKKSKEQKMSSDKNANDNNKKKTISYLPLIVFGIIILILAFIVLTKSNFTLKIKGNEFSYTSIEENSYLPIIFILAMVGFLFCIGMCYIVSYKILEQEEKLGLLKEIFTKECLTISEDKTITKKNENPLNPAIITETIDSHKYDSKSKVLISAIEAIKDL